MQGQFIFGVALILPHGLHVPLELVTFKKSVHTTQEARGISQLRLHRQAKGSTNWWGFWSSKLSCPVNRSWTPFLAQTPQCCLLVCKPVHGSWVCLIWLCKDTSHRLGEFWCPQVPFIDSSALYLGEVSPNTANQVLQALGSWITLYTFAVFFVPLKL